MGLSGTVSEIKYFKHNKSKIFPPRVFNAPLRAEGFPLEFCSFIAAVGLKKTGTIPLPDRPKKLTLCPFVYSHSYQRLIDRRRDGRAETSY